MVSPKRPGRQSEEVKKLTPALLSNLAESAKAIRDSPRETVKPRTAISRNSAAAGEGGGRVEVGGVGKFAFSSPLFADLTRTRATDRDLLRLVFGRDHLPN